MNNKNILIGVVVAVLLFGAYYLGTKNNNTQIEVSDINTSTTTGNVVITASTSVTNKPVVKTPAIAYTSNYIKIGQRTLLNGVYVMPSKVTYDSRCPRDVQCIQAGTVELGVILQSGSALQNVIITLGKPFLFEGKTVTLTAVSPSKVSTKTINESDYRFILSVKN